MLHAPPPIPAALRDRALLLAHRPDRAILGIAGPPGAGKSTAAAALCAVLDAVRPGCCAVVPMDGFHLANSVLAGLGRKERKGAPDTFDACGYVALLRRLRGERDAVVYAPEFRRRSEEPIAGAIAVAPSVTLVITEGNYLLCDGDFAPVAGLLDEAWYLDPGADECTRRLHARHVAHGRTPDEATAWIASTDAPNARFIAATKGRADLVWDGGPAWEPGGAA